MDDFTLEAYNNLDPMIITLITPTPLQVKYMPEVTSTAIIDNTTDKMHTDGLYSQEKFGTVGSPLRDKQFGYIKLGIDIIHPLIYNYLCDLSKLYKNIMNGVAYATWDNELKDFVKSDVENGRTGINFFILHYKTLVPTRNKSVRRTKMINVFEKHIESLKTGSDFRYCLVYPAGLRDYMEDENGRPQEDEVNDLYKRVINYSKFFKIEEFDDDELDLVNSTRLLLQKSVVAVHDHFIELNNGKNRFMKGQVTKRSIENGTRNVLTSIPMDITDIDDPDNMTMNNGTIPLIQYASSIAPLFIYGIRKHFLDKVFISGETTIQVLDVKRKMFKNADITSTTLDIWLSSDDLSDMLVKMKDQDFITSPVIIDKVSPFMVYDTGGSVQLIVTPDDYDDTMVDKFIRPITYGEMVFISVLENVKDIPIIYTRFPVAEQGSIVPLYPIISSTNKTRSVLLKLNSTDVGQTAPRYPMLNKFWLLSMSVHYSRLSGFQADHDGDKLDAIALMKSDSRIQVDNYIKTPMNIISPSGDPTCKLVSDIVGNVLKTMTM